MKSERAKGHIQTFGRGLDDIMFAEAVVRLAEQDARERAVKALIASCPFCDDGRKHCWRDGKTCDEACVVEFLKYYDNEA